MRAFYYICHVLAQMTRWHRFLSLALPESLEVVKEKDLESFSREDFRALCEELYEDLSFSLLVRKAQESGFFSSKEELVGSLYEPLRDSLKEGCSLVVLGDSLYPPLLLESEDKPLCLFVKGNPHVLKKKMIAIVGSRRASSYALDKSFEMAAFLKEKDYGVVSGGAYGCDALAHKGALSLKGEASTLAVLSGGLKSLYPSGNLSLFKDIVERGGALVTERLWHQFSRPYDFPIRNRIISGLCETTLVMDASVKSGTLVTAYKALDQGRNVFVLKPEEGGVRASGVELLMEEGAASFETNSDLMSLLGEGSSCV